MARKKQGKITLVNVVNDSALYRNTRMPALSLACLSAVIPKSWDVRIVDETVERFNAVKHVAEGPDIIAISGGNVCNITRIVGMLGSIEYQDVIQGRETTVFLGGYVGGLDLEGLPSKVDASFIGPGERTIRQALHDFNNGGVKPTYTGTRIPMNELKRPDFSRFDLGAYGKRINYPVQTSVSCHRKCTFCSARKVYGDGYEARNPELVIADMEQFPKGSRVYFTDPNLVDFSKNGIARAKRFFKGIAPKEHSWFGSVSFKITEHEDVLAMMRDAGCRGLLIGYDSANLPTLQAVSGEKLPEGNLHDYYVEGTKMIQEKYGINIVGTFVIGHDTDDNSVFGKTTKVVKESEMFDAQYLDFTPLPGTTIYDELSAAGRIYDTNFANYDFSTVVFQPNQLSSQELRRGVVQMFEDTFPRMLRLYRRLGAIRDRPDEIMIPSMRAREAQERETRRRREGGGGHH